LCPSFPDVGTSRISGQSATSVAGGPATLVEDAQDLDGERSERQRGLVPIAVTVIFDASPTSPVSRPGAIRGQPYPICRAFDRNPLRSAVGDRLGDSGRACDLAIRTIEWQPWSQKQQHNCRRALDACRSSPTHKGSTEMRSGEDHNIW
jgi:hypothetical protein